MEKCKHRVSIGSVCIFLHWIFHWSSLRGTESIIRTLYWHLYCNMLPDRAGRPGGQCSSWGWRPWRPSSGPGWGGSPAGRRHSSAAPGLVSTDRDQWRPQWTCPTHTRSEGVMKSLISHVMMLTCMTTISMRNMTKWKWLFWATQFPTQGQWWSNVATQWSHTEQCLDLRGFFIRQVQQNLPGPSASSMSLKKYVRRKR